MSLIDNDLLSIQEARILLEHAAESAEVLEGLPASLVDDFLTHLRERILPKVREYAEASFAESDYCSPEDESELTKWVLGDLLDDVRTDSGAEDHPLAQRLRGGMPSQGRGRVAASGLACGPHDAQPALHGGAFQEPDRLLG